MTGSVKGSVQTKDAQTTECVTGNGLLIAVIAAVVVLTLLRFVLAGVIELLPEEAYYWMYSKNPALGYFDHPPMVAWIIAAGTAMFGDTQMGVRFGTFVLWVASCGLLFLTGRLWFGKRAALVAALLFTLAPVYVGMGLIVTPDMPVVFFWLATLYFISQALHTGRGAYWLLAGVTFGGALLSKYYALLLAPSVLLFVAISPTHRRWLRRPQFWFALPIALLVFSPVIIWNAQHDWASFLFQSTRTSVPQKHTVGDVMEFWIMQVAVLSPLFLVLFVCAVARGIRLGWRQREDRWNFVASFSLPLFFLFVAASLKTEVHVNWTAPAFLSLALGAGVIAQEGLDSADAARAKRWRIGASLVTVVSVVAIVLGHTSLAWGQPKVFAYTRAGSWHALAREVAGAREECVRQTGQRPFVLGMDKYNIAAELGFYLQHPEECVNMYALGARGQGFRYWTDLRKFEGQPAIAVLGRLRKDLMDELHRHFDDVDEPVEVHLRGHGARHRAIYLVRCRGYQAEEKEMASSRP